MKRCPCHSGRVYQDCCEPWHQGAAPPTAEALMRSRYAAYALGLVDYVMDSTHPQFRRGDTQTWRDELSDFCQSTRFTALRIMDAHDNGDEATVHFYAGLRQGRKDVSFAELSSFQRLAGRWFYKDAIT